MRFNAFMVGLAALNLAASAVYLKHRQPFIAIACFFTACGSVAMAFA